MCEEAAERYGAGCRESSAARRLGRPVVLLASCLLTACLRLHSTLPQPADEAGCPKITYLLASNERVVVFFFAGGTITRRTIHPDTYALPEAACQVRDPDLVHEAWLEKKEFSDATVEPDAVAAALSLKENLPQQEVVVLRVAPATEEFILTGMLSRSTLSSKPVTLVVYTTRENMKSPP